MNYDPNLIDAEKGGLFLKLYQWKLSDVPLVDIIVHLNCFTNQIDHIQKIVNIV